MSEPNSVSDVIRAASRSNGETAQRGRIVNALPPVSAEAAAAENVRSGRASQNQPVQVVDYVRAATAANNAANIEAAKGAPATVKPVADHIVATIAEKATAAIMAGVTALFRTK